MNKKLILTIQESVIEMAEEYARRKNKDLSDLVENYFISLMDEDEETDSEWTPGVAEMKGAFKMPENIDYKKDVVGKLSKKYL